MRKVPTHSTYSVREGMWFVFNLDDHAFGLWLSSITGKEEFYVDGALVSERQAISLSSRHTVSVGTVQYVVSLATRKLKEGRFECTLSRDGAFVQGFTTEYVYKRSPAVRVATIAASAAGTLVVLQAGLSAWHLVLLFVGLLLAFMLPTSGKGFAFSELEAPRGSDA